MRFGGVLVSGNLRSRSASFFNSRIFAAGYDNGTFSNRLTVSVSVLTLKV
jgi:hypothetical protein